RRMGSGRTTRKLLRAALAAVFGLMSLAHQPVMAFAKSNSASPCPPAGITAQAVHQHQHHQHSTPAVPQTSRASDGDIPCSGLGCFQSLTPAPSLATVLYWLVLGRLLPAAPRGMTAAQPDPAEPPPRLQAQSF